jgi:hypothetical protein
LQPEPLESWLIDYAEEMLRVWTTISGARDLFVKKAHAAGMSKHRIHVITGIARSTIDRIIRST